MNTFKTSFAIAAVLAVMWFILDKLFDPLMGFRDNDPWTVFCAAWAGAAIAMRRLRDRSCKDHPNV